MKLWGGRFSENTDKLVEEYTASIAYDQRLAALDIAGSIAHARMLGHTGILPKSEADLLVTGLEAIAQDVEKGKVAWRVEDEDIHMNVERLLQEKVPTVAGKLHTARSRNDQVALDMHLYMKSVLLAFVEGIRRVQQALVQKAEENLGVIIPGYTHLQRAQPILLSHHLLAYVWMLERDAQRFQDSRRRTDLSPLGAGALAGTTFPIDREWVAAELGLAGVYENSLDAVSDRDYLLEFLSAAGILVMHLSRLSEELVLWTSEEFGFIELSDAYCTGSSMMPQKKNPDVPELVRGKAGRVFGHLMALLTVLKGLPLAYNKDLQEDKEGVFDTVDTLLPALTLFAGMIRTMKLRSAALERAFAKDFSNATDVADYLVNKGVAFREAHSIVGQLVMAAMAKGTNLAGLSLADLRAFSPAFDEDVHCAMALETVVNARNSRGGTGMEAVKIQLEKAKQVIASPHESM